jgi:hypothetical protein
MTKKSSEMTDPSFFSLCEHHFSFISLILRQRRFFDLLVHRVPYPGSTGNEVRSSGKRKIQNQLSRTTDNFKEGEDHEPTLC